jgi:hypothetical protein
MTTQSESIDPGHFIKLFIDNYQGFEDKECKYHCKLITIDTDVLIGSFFFNFTNSITFVTNSADADEFFSLMKEMLLKELLPSPENLTIPRHPNDDELHSTMKDFWNMFESGQIEQRITCMKCMNVTKKINSFMSLPLQFPYQNFHDNANDTKKTISLIDLIHHYQCDDDDDVTNYECANCLDRQRATKTYRICRYPAILCIRIGHRKSSSISVNWIRTK